ncbi:Metallo-dependent phosphatase-like protein, partial [Massariosphaeria phaeospora]
HFHPPNTFPLLAPYLFLLAPYLFLLGDIGLTRHPALFTFLRTLLAHSPRLTIFYVPGNHEAYGLTLAASTARLHVFECEFRGRFWVMERRRVDLGARVTVLGCTLWSRITEAQEAKCWSTMADFRAEGGIQEWDVAAHNACHARDLAWLNARVRAIQTTSPDRDIVILTHHCPSTDPRASDPRHVNSSISEGFSTDLSREACWRSASVKLWAFGHTHWNVQYVDDTEGREMLVVANQKGYARGGGVVRSVVVDGEGGKWKVVVGKGAVNEGGDGSKGKVSVRGEIVKGYEGEGYARGPVTWC